MSRSSRPLIAPACVAVGAAALSLLLVTGVAPAWAETTPGPVKDLEAPSVDLHTGVSSLDGTVTVEGTRRGAKARIDATVLFGKDSAQLRPGARARIRQVAKEFARNGTRKSDAGTRSWRRRTRPRGCRRTRPGRSRCRCPPAARSSRLRIASTMEVTGWFSANARTGPGMVSVGTNAELMNGRKISG